MIDEDKVIFNYQVKRVASMFNSNVQELTKKLLQEFIIEESVIVEGGSLEGTIYSRFDARNIQR